MNAAEVVQSVTQEGCVLSIDGEKIKGDKRLPDELMNALKENKQSIIKLLKRDKLARSFGFLIGISGELYTQSVSRRADVFIEKVGGNWTAYRSTFIRGNPEAVSTKTIATGKTFDYVLLKAKKYFNYLNKVRRK